MIVKNHVFIDGNKRIAATLFIYFLNYYDILYKDDKQVIDNNTLTALTLLIAESNPKEKEVIIDLVMNFLNQITFKNSLGEQLKMNKKEKAREFCLEVKKLAKKYGLPFFIVTDGALLLVIIIVVL